VKYNKGVSKQFRENTVNPSDSSGVSSSADSPNPKYSGICGSPLWLAPEIILGGRADFSADIWALGITAIEISEGEPPRTDLKVDELLREIVNGPPPTPSLIFWSKAFRDFISKCLTKDISKRPTAQSLLVHPFIKSAPTKRVLIPVVKRFLHLPKYRPFNFQGSYDLIRENTGPPVVWNEVKLANEWA